MVPPLPPVLFPPTPPVLLLRPASGAAVPPWPPSSSAGCPASAVDPPCAFWPPPLPADDAFVAPLPPAGPAPPDPPLPPVAGPAARPPWLARPPVMPPV